MTPAVATPQRPPAAIASTAACLLGRHSAPTAAVLECSRVHARLDGLLLQVRAEQHYRHRGDLPLEVVYEFPLPVDAVLLGMDVTLAGRRLDGTVVRRAAAERRYEQAIGRGDLPVMVESLGDQRWRVHLGNLAPGESVVLELRYAQLVSFEQEQVRLAFPSTIAPRYGQPRDDPMQLGSEYSLLVEHPLEFTLDICGDLARADLACPTHPISVATRDPACTRMALTGTAWLDRDVIVTLRPLDVDSVVSAAVDPVAGSDSADAPRMATVLASFRPRIPRSSGAPRDGIDLKILVDCSSSMAGDSIASARAGLLELTEALQPADRFSYSRFGSTCQHDLRRLVSHTPTNVDILRVLIDKTGAYLGGTEMRRALQSLFDDVPVAEARGPVDVLLITDGQVEDRSAIVDAARASGHRIFAIGVGSSPNAHLLRETSEATGGACEFVTPGEGMREALRRMMARLREPALPPLRLLADRGGVPCHPTWLTSVPRSVFDGETVHVFAAFALDPAGQSSARDGAPLRLRLAAAGTEGAQVIAQASLPWPPPAGDTDAIAPMLVRMGAWRRLQERELQGEESVALALRYQLVTPATRMLCVHERADADKVLDFAMLHREPLMLSAGHAATGSVAARARGALADYEALRRRIQENTCSLSIPTPTEESPPAQTDPLPQVAKASDPARPEGSVEGTFEKLISDMAGGSSVRHMESRLHRYHPAVHGRYARLVKLGMNGCSALALLVRTWAAARMVLPPEVAAKLDAHIGELTQEQRDLAAQPWV